MPSFTGQYTYTLDSKGRLTIPSRYREELPETLAVTRSMDRCLTVYPMDVWEEITAKVDALSITDSRGRDLRRYFYADATLAEPDRQGRILLPDRLREHAGLELNNEVIIAGTGRYFEIWNPQRWEEECIRQAKIVDEDPAIWDGLQI